jgi:hypothetical protein
MIFLDKRYVGIAPENSRRMNITLARTSQTAAADDTNRVQCTSGTRDDRLNSVDSRLGIAEPDGRDRRK